MNGLKLFHHSPTVVTGNGAGVSPVGQYTTNFLNNDLLCRKISASNIIASSARRKLFNVEASTAADQASAIRAELLSKFHKLRRSQSTKWNFDFSRETPLPGPYAWFKSESKMAASLESPKGVLGTGNGNLSYSKGTIEQTTLISASPFAKFFHDLPAAEPCLSLDCQNCTSRLMNEGSPKQNSQPRVIPKPPLLQTKITDFFPQHKKPVHTSSTILTPPDTVVKKGTTAAPKRPFDEGDTPSSHDKMQDPNTKPPTRCHKRLAFLPLSTSPFTSMEAD